MSLIQFLLGERIVRDRKRKTIGKSMPPETRFLSKARLLAKNHPPEAKSPQKNRRVILTRLFLTSSLS